MTTEMKHFEISRFWVRTLRARFRDHKAELVAIRRHVKPGDIVCDVGANKGSFLYWLSRWSGDGKVIAFEPQPDLASGLSHICATLCLRNVRVEQKAVYSSSGTPRDLFIPDGHAPGASLSRVAGKFATITVPTISLDDYFSEDDRVSAFKIDVEGAEIHALKGAERILRQNRPLVVVECETRHLPPSTSVNDVFSFLSSLGYEGSFVCRGTVLPLAQFDVDVHQNNQTDWFWKDKGYCNNFIFRHPRSFR
jgi:FkbM family methyltransferase